VANILADGTGSLNITRAMGFGSVNALKVTSVVGHQSEIDDEFRVTRMSNDDKKTSGGHQAVNHRNSQLS